MMDHFHHRSQIALLLKFTRVHIHQCKKFIGIHQIKIPGQCKIACRNGISFYKRMTKLNIVFSLRAITKMPQQ